VINPVEDAAVWAPPDATATAIAGGSEAPATIRDAPPFEAWRVALPALVLVLVVGLGTVAATMIPFDPGGNDDARIEVAIDHRDGASLAVAPDRTLPADGLPSRLLLEVDGDRLLDASYPLVTADGRATSLAFERIAVPPGTHDVTLLLVDGGTETTVFDDTVALDAGQALTIDVGDGQSMAEAHAGQSLYFETTLGTNAGCRICHSLDEGVTLVGPSLAGIETAAATRVPGLSAEEYLRQSIVDPDTYIVEGLPAGQMVPNYLDLLSEDGIENLVAYLLTIP
jgi:mono/diheme cytochrome c family protein